MKIPVLSSLVLAAAVSAQAQVEYSPSEQLLVNTDDSRRFVTELSLEEGLASLEDVVFENELEEAWLFDGSYWFEIGYEASNESSSSISDLINGVVRTERHVRTDEENYLIRRPFSSADIHIHPIKNSPDYKFSLCQGYNVLRVLMSRIRVKHALPSYDDLDKMFFDLDVEPERNSDFTFYIGSFGGITEYFLTDKGREYSLSMTETERNEFITNIETKIQEEVSAQFTKDPNNLDYSSMLNETFKQSSDDMVTIRFTSYRKLQK